MESGELFNFCGRLRHDGQSLEHIGLLVLLVIRAGVNVEVSAGHGVERDLIRGRDGEDRIAASGGVNSRTDYSYQLSKSLFNNRVKAVIGGKFSTDADPTENLKENLIDDVALEYQLTKRDNMFLKIFRHTGYESILEGEITETGVGFVIRKKMLKLGDLFRIMRNKVQPQTPPKQSPHE